MWKEFQPREIKLAKQFAEEGGVAVHWSGFTFRGHKTCHLLAKDKESLLEAARLCGCNVAHVQNENIPNRVLHFDLFGRPLRTALSFCDRDHDAEKA